LFSRDTKKPRRTLDFPFFPFDDDRTHDIVSKFCAMGWILGEDGDKDNDLFGNRRSRALYMDPDER